MRNRHRLAIVRCQLRCPKGSKWSTWMTSHNGQRLSDSSRSRCLAIKSVSIQTQRLVKVARMCWRMGPQLCPGLRARTSAEPPPPRPAPHARTLPWSDAPRAPRCALCACPCPPHAPRADRRPCAGIRSVEGMPLGGVLRPCAGGDVCQTSALEIVCLSRKDT